MFFTRSQPIAHTPTSTPKPSVPQYQDTQSQSLLFNRLPAEIRNKIYTHVFTTLPAPTITAAEQGNAVHPLSLLLTCRRINAEANILAFSTYTFPLHPNTEATYLSLCAALSHLSTAQVSAMTSLSVLSSSNASSFLSNALLILSNLSHFSVKSLLPRRPTQSERSEKRACRTSHRSAGLAYPIGACSTAITEDPAHLAIARYAPHCLTTLLHTVSSGKAYKWQSGEMWSVQWPQLDSPYIYSKVQCDKDELREELVMDSDGIGTMDGVELCVCGCGNVSWTGTVLVQEGGRRVNVGIVYCGQPDTPDPNIEYVPKVVLVPGTAPASGVVAEGAGFRYEADEEYWEATRRRNGNVGALWRGVWRTTAAWPAAAMAYKNESYSKLTA